MSVKKSEKSFAAGMERLEEIVRLLEKGEAPLEESLALYTEGAELIRLCSKVLDQAEQTVLRVRKGPDGAPVEQPFTPGSD